MIDKARAQTLIVLAMGGNALIKPGQVGTVYQQFANTREMLKPVVEVIKQGYQVVLTHGNGPQVGHRLITVESALNKVPEMPLGILVAESEGWMAYMISQSLLNMLQLSGIKKPVVSLLTQVLVDQDDPASFTPTKPIGSFYTERQARYYMSRQGWQMVFDSQKGWRRVVPSPIPLEIVEKETIKLLLAHDTIMIACGGGGIPVYKLPNGVLEGLDGVIDKDLASSVLGRDVNADLLIIITDVSNAMLNYGKKNCKKLGHITDVEAQQYYVQGHFPAGSMGPKIKACIDFVRSGGKAGIITSSDKLLEALQGKAGTIITRQGSYDVQDTDSR